MSTRTFVTTDTHGCNEQLKKALELASFDYDVDTLIHLGDCTDRGPDSYGVIETLLSIKNLIPIMGNHDHYMKNFIVTGFHPWEHGSSKTLLSYVNSGEFTWEEVYVKYKRDGVDTNFKPEHMPKSHRDFFMNQQLYHVDEQNRLFVHAGYDIFEKVEHQSQWTLTWSRDLVQRLAAKFEKEGPLERYPDVNDFKRVFVGHTPTLVFKRQVDKLSPLWLPGGVPYTEPMYLAQLVNLDTGACFDGKLSLIDITDDENHILYQA